MSLPLPIPSSNSLPGLGCRRVGGDSFPAWCSEHLLGLVTVLIVPHEYNLVKAQDTNFSPPSRRRSGRSSPSFEMLRVGRVTLGSDPVVDVSSEDVERHGAIFQDNLVELLQVELRAECLP